MFRTFTIISLCAITIFAANAKADTVYNWIKPVSAEADSYYEINDLHGKPEFAFDDDTYSGWTMRGLGKITFDLGGQYDIQAVNIYWGGTASNGNIANVYVDDTLVISAEKFGPWQNNKNFSEIQGRYISYETLPLEHYPGQIAGYSEIGDISVLAAAVPEPASLSILAGGAIILLNKKRRNKISK